MAEDKISLKVVKLALLGDSSVGKTALCNSLMNLEFSEEKLSTIGIDKLETKFPLKNGTEIKLVLWDTAGQERFRSMALKTLRAVQGIVVVFDVTKRKTFESVNSWLEEIRECLDNPCLILFGNKIDIDKKEWQVTKEEVEKFAGSLNLTYFETSAKTKQGLNEGFSFIVNKAYDRVKAQSGINLEEDEYEIVNGCFGKKKRRKKKNKDKDKDKDSDKGKVKEKNKK
jgi:small GTP-binding protein